MLIGISSHCAYFSDKHRVKDEASPFDLIPNSVVFIDTVGQAINHKEGAE